MPAVVLVTLVTPQVPALTGALPAPLHDPGMGLLGGHVCQGHGAGEGGPAEGDGEDDGSEERHLLDELGNQQRHPAQHQRPAPHPHSQGDSRADSP